jgi:hypothetical protein
MNKKLACAALAAACVVPYAVAQESYPNRPIQVILPLQVGSASDIAVRLVAERLAEILGQNVVVEIDALTQANRPNHMTVVEVWRNAKDQEAHTMHADTRRFRDSLAGVAPGSGVAADPLFVINPLSGSLYDEQLYTSID